MPDAKKDLTGTKRPTHPDPQRPNSIGPTGLKQKEHPPLPGTPRPLPPPKDPPQGT